MLKLRFLKSEKMGREDGLDVGLLRSSCIRVVRLGGTKQSKQGAGRAAFGFAEGNLSRDQKY